MILSSESLARNLSQPAREANTGCLCEVLEKFLRRVYRRLDETQPHAMRGFQKALT
jgi:hypothetical protein